MLVAPRTVGPTAIATTAAPASSRGLTDAEAAARRAAGDGNDVGVRTTSSYWEILRQNAYLGINGPLIVISLLLLGAGLPVDAALTAGPVVLNIGVGVVQEGRAKRQLDRIALLERPMATVVRSGVERATDPAELVLGDIVVARRGDQIVVDGTVVGDERAELDESLLTGESDAVLKALGDDVWSGTAVVSGTLVYVATRVGTAKVADRLLDEARGMADHQTPLQRGIAVVIWVIAGLVASVAALVAITGLPGDEVGSTETLQAAAVLVSLVPQGLAIMVTVTYAAGALRVTRLGALVQRRNAVESMSRVDTLCLDKTGTLTTQRISLAGMELLGRGASTDPSDARHARAEAVVGALASSTRAPNRITEALATAIPAPTYALADEVPFSSERRWSAARFAAPLPREPGAVDRLADTSPPVGSVLVLGAPEALAPSLSTDRGTIDARSSRLAEDGARVLLVACGPVEAALRDDSGAPLLPAPLEPLALLAFREELRPDARDTLSRLAAAGVELKVISGDDPATVDAVGRQVGIEAVAAAASGMDLEALGDAQLSEVAERSTVFGRVGPSLKARIVAALRARDHYVAMIGDGVNDLLPLRQAQLGIAMESGSPATRGAADLVLLRDAFAVLPRAVVEGQRILAGMEATLIILLARTFYVLLIVAGSALAGLPFPLTPRQNGALALVTVGIPLIVLVLWVPPKRAPRDLIPATLRISIPASIAVAALALPVYAVAVDLTHSTAEAQSILTTLTVFCGLGLLPLIYPAGGDRSMSRVRRAWPWLLSAAMAIVYLAILRLPIAGDLYELVTPSTETLLILLGMGIAWTGVIHLIRRAATGPTRRMGDVGPSSTATDASTDLG